MRITKEKSVGLIIDMQERLIPAVHENEKIVRNIHILIEGLKLLEIPLLWTEQYPKGLGGTVEPLRSLMAPTLPVEKISFSCCDNPLFTEKLNLLNKRFVIVAGVESHVCVMQTVTDLVELGHIPAVVEDCVSSRTAENKRNGIERMRDEGAVITCLESVLFELCRVAGSPVFKEISKAIK